MAITSVELLWTGRGGTDTIRNRRTYRAAYEILTDDAEELLHDVANASGVPQIGDAHPEDAGAFVVDFDLAQDEDDPFKWHFTAKYDSQPDLPEPMEPEGGSTLEPGEVPANPLDRPAVWSISFQRATEAGTNWYRVTGAEPGTVAGTISPLHNSADLPFDPTVPVEVSRPVLRVTKNLSPATATVAFFLALQDAVNTVAWRGVGPRCAKIDGVTGTGGMENGVKFVTVTLDIALKWDTWDVRILDAGFATREERAGIISWSKIRDPFGQPASEPVPLDGSGLKLAADGTPVFLRGVPTNYQLQPFATLLSWL